MKVNDQSHFPTSSRQSKESLVPIERKSGWALEGVWKFRSKISFSLPGFEPWTLQPVAWLLYWLDSPRITIGWEWTFCLKVNGRKCYGCNLRYIHVYILRERYKWENIRTTGMSAEFQTVDLLNEIRSLAAWARFLDYFILVFNEGGTRWRSWLRHCATSRKFADSIPDGVIGFFHWHNPSGHTMALGSTQPLTEMSARNASWGVKGGRCVRLTTLPPSFAECLVIWEPQPPGMLRACPGLKWDCITFYLCLMSQRL